MIGLGTIVNTLSIIIGGLLGLLLKKVFKKISEEQILKACGISILFISISGAMEGMLSINEGQIHAVKSMFIVLSILIGTLIGELINIEGAFERFGNFLKMKTGNKEDTSFVSAFVTASLTVCIGAMAIVGSIEDGINKDATTLLIKSILDFIIIFVMATSLGKGAIFSFIPVFLLEGAITLLASLLTPIFSNTILEVISMIGSILIFCVGINLTFGKTIKVANMLPSILIACLLSMLNIPW